MLVGQNRRLGSEVVGATSLYHGSGQSVPRRCVHFGGPRCQPGAIDTAQIQSGRGHRRDDAVVTDRDGNVVRDLTAADFEVLQNRRRQKIAFAAFAEFVPVMTVAASRASLTVPGTSAPPVAGNALGGPPPRPPTGQAQRTFVIVVDDLGLSAEGMNNVRRGLREFVETGLLPTDLAAIVRTGEVRGLLQALTGDRAALGAAVDALRYNVMSRKGVSTSDDVIQAGDATPAFNGVGPLQRSVSTAGSLAALNLVVRAARDLPGRKTVIVASEGFQLWEETRATKTPEEDPRVRYAVDRVVDQATRSGVVI